MSKNKIGGSNHPVNPKQDDAAEKKFALAQFNKPGGGQSTSKK